MVVIFSDIDGTLLDFETYSFAKAEEALRELRQRRIPLILASSKTRAEIEPIRECLGIEDPFIVENGGALYVPEIFVADLPPGMASKDSYLVREFGMPYTEIVARFRKLKDDFNLPVTGIHEMSPAEVAALTGISEENARIAMRREYSEPFIAGENFDPAAIDDALRTTNLRLSRGDRFYHLSGPNDKGMAVRSVIALYEAAIAPGASRIITIGLGDSPNDLEMLLTVDFPFAVEKPDGKIDPVLRDAGIPSAGGIGPKGWNDAVLAALHRFA